MRPVRSLATAGSIAVLAAACGGGFADGQTVPAGASSGSPVTVENCGQPITFDAPPERAFANDINTTEAMLALGLADRMVGMAGVGGRDEVLAELAEDFRSVERVSEQYIELEPLLGTGADFIFAGWNYGFSEGTGMTPDSLAERGVAAYALTESCAHVQPDKGPTSIEETFQDLRNLGLIFGVTDRAATIIEEMQTVLTEVEAAASDRAPRRIFVYSQGEDAPVTTPGLTIATDLIARAGGENIFADLRQPPTTVSWEQVIDRDPECIIVVEHGPMSWEEKRDFLRGNPAFAEITAIQDDCFLPLPYAAVTPGIRNADAVRAIAELLHDDASGR